MNQITVSSSEFYDVIIALILDMIKYDNITTDNERWNEFIEYADRQLSHVVRRNYIEMNGNERIKFKILKKALESNKESKINIVRKSVTNLSEEDANEDDNEFDRELCKQIFRKIKEVRFKHPSKVLTEERIDKIIDYCVEQKKQQEEQNG